ncbi:DUF5719 family protein [Sanguibacter sp. A247]|uniref:DUF5719 family protein n=1 Tax=unclassified Sanguibacter TaxID=2645534 RepID=UPI003FD7A682
MSSDENDMTAPDPAPEPRPRQRGAAVVRALTGLVVVGLAGATAWAVDLLPTEPLSGPAAQGQSVVPSSAALVCAGPVQLADATASADPAFDPTPVGTATRLGAVVLAPATAGTAPVRGIDGGTVDPVTMVAGASAFVARGPVAGATTVTVAPAPDGSAPFGAAVVSATTAGDLRGLAGASCVTPSAEQWLLGGTTTRGASTRLVVQNSSRTPAVVDVELWGPGGRIDPSGPTTMTVPAGGQAARLLESLAPEQRLLGVRVVARGALVSSYLQVNALDGLRPAGVDLASASTPAVRQVISGVTTGPAGPARLDVLVPRAAQPASSAADDAADDGLALPDATGGEDVVAAPVSVSVAILGPQGRVLVPGAESLDVTPGELASLDLGALEAGRYTVVLDAAVPLVASATVVRAGTDGEDVALLASRGASHPGTSLVAVPAGTRGTLTVAAVPAAVDEVPGAALGTGGPVDADGAPVALATRAAELLLLSPDGRTLATERLAVPVGGTLVLPLDARAQGAEVAAVVVRTTGEGPGLAWSLEASADALDGTRDGLLTVLAPAAVEDTALEVVVRPAHGF